MAKNSPKLMTKQQMTGPRSSENNKWNECQKILYLGTSYSN